MDVRKQQQQEILQQEILQWTSGALRGGAMVVRERQLQEILQETGARRDAIQKRVLQRTSSDPRRKAGKTLTRMMSGREQMMRQRCQTWRHKALTGTRSMAEGRPSL